MAEEEQQPTAEALKQRRKREKAAAKDAALGVEKFTIEVAGIFKADLKRLMKQHGFNNQQEVHQTLLRNVIAAIHELRALLDAPAKLPMIDAHNERLIASLRNRVNELEAAKPQGVPVAWHCVGDIGTEHVTLSQDCANVWFSHGGRSLLLVYAEQPAPVAVMPDGYCIMPRQLTAENGAKALLLGEFKLLTTMECPECCGLDEPTEGCSICDGEGEYGQKHTIPWDQIKFIYSKAVAGLALKAESAKSR